MLNSNKKNLLLKSFFVSFLILFIFFTAGKAQAASLYFIPSTGNYNVGDIINVSILVDTQNVPINSAEANISFPSDILSVVSVNKTNSVFTFWVQEPTFSNVDGTISLSGGLPTPGYNGSLGKVSGISFRVKKAGLVSLSFASGAVRANDGLGTDVLQNSKPASFVIKPQVEAPPAVVPETITTPTVMTPLTVNTTPTNSNGAQISSLISSPTNPDPNKWYNDSNPKFTWTVPSDVTDIKLSYNKLPNSLPTVIYTPPISEKDLTDLKDGTYYFHLQFKNANGWGTVSNFRFNIDTQNPSSFDVREIPRTDATIPQAKFSINAKDDLSGVDHYELQIDQNPVVTWDDDGTHVYQTPILNPGQHEFNAKVYDKAGNFLGTTTSFTIDPLQTPTITDYSKDLSVSGSLIIRGQTQSSGQVTIYLQKNNESPKSFVVQSNQNGEFVFAPDSQLSSGIYTAWVEALDARGAKSLATDKVTIVVKNPLLSQIGTWSTNILSAMIPIVALICLLILVILYFWHKFLVLKKRIRMETRGVEKSIRKAFDVLRDDMIDQMNMLKKAKSQRDLTIEEEKIMKQLRKNMSMAEDFLQKEIETIEKELE